MDATALSSSVLTLVGGGGTSLPGMRNTSEGMQAVAGNTLRRMIRAVTKNRLMATTDGTVVTCVVQSISIATVMNVGLDSTAFPRRVDHRLPERGVSKLVGTLPPPEGHSSHEGSQHRVGEHFARRPIAGCQ